MAEWYGAGLKTARSRVRIPQTAAVCQRQLSMPSLRGRLMSTSESRGVNGHTTRCTGPVSVVLRLRLVYGCGLWNGDQRRPMGLKARERTLLYFTFIYWLIPSCCSCDVHGITCSLHSWLIKGSVRFVGSLIYEMANVWAQTEYVCLRATVELKYVLSDSYRLIPIAKAFFFVYRIP